MDTHTRYDQLRQYRRNKKRTEPSETWSQDQVLTTENVWHSALGYREPSPLPWLRRQFWTHSKIYVGTEKTGMFRVGAATKRITQHTRNLKSFQTIHLLQTFHRHRRFDNLVQASTLSFFSPINPYCSMDLVMNKPIWLFYFHFNPRSTSLLGGLFVCVFFVFFWKSEMRISNANAHLIVQYMRTLLFLWGYEDNIKTPMKNTVI